MQAWLQKLGDFLLIEVNGLVVLLYWVLDRWAALVSLLCGLVILFVFDQEVVRVASQVPRRAGEEDVVEPVSRASPVVRLSTIISIVAWQLAAGLFPTPVPELGMLVWLGGVALLLALPPERPVVLHRVKAITLSYSGVLFAFYIWSLWASRASPQEWARIVGSTGDAARLIAGSRSIMNTIATWVAWGGIPLAFFTYAGQRLLTNPHSITNPLQSARDILEEIRRRE